MLIALKYINLNCEAISYLDRNLSNLYFLLSSKKQKKRNESWWNFVKLNCCKSAVFCSLVSISFTENKNKMFKPKLFFPHWAWAATTKPFSHFHLIRENERNCWSLNQESHLFCTECYPRIKLEKWILQ